MKQVQNDVMGTFAMTGWSVLDDQVCDYSVGR